MYATADTRAFTRIRLQLPTPRLQLGGNFVLLEEKKAGQMKLFVYIRIELSEQTGMVTNLVKGSENTGVGHVLANKGGQAISFTLNGTTSFCFVNSHLAAHEGKVRQRRLTPLPTLSALHSDT
jgi:hypothetical protein